MDPVVFSAAGSGQKLRVHGLRISAKAQINGIRRFAAFFSYCVREFGCSCVNFQETHFSF